MFAYNTAVTNIDRTVIRNTYIDRRVVDTRTVGRASYNGPGGVTVRPRPAEYAGTDDRHVAPTPAQVQHAQYAAQDRNMYSTVNRNRPATTAVARPIDDAHAIPHSKPVTQADRERAVPVQRGDDQKQRPPHQ
jgi:hypothetical protein